jgi:hypothetical protein
MMTRRYKLEQPLVSITYTTSNSVDGGTALLNTSNPLDFTCTDSSLSNLTYNQYPDIALFPMMAAAIVPV